jgi:hypothetical protein
VPDRRAQRPACQEDDDEPKVYRLRDMVVEEVSLVDRAANKRRFLIVKRSDEMAEDDRVGAEVRPDGRGGLTAGGVEKAKKKPGAGATDDETADEQKRKKPADGGDEDTAKARRRGAAEGDGDEEAAQKARRPKRKDGESDGEDETAKAKGPKNEADDEGDGDGDEQKRKQADGLTIPKPVKEAVIRTLTEALERLMNVANRVREAEETNEQVDAPVPDEVGTEVRAIAELLGGFGESYPSPTAKAAVAKAGARMAKDRLDRFQKAMTLLADILKELSDVKDPVAAPTAGAAEAGRAAGIGAGVRKRDDVAAAKAVPGLAELVSGIGELTRVVKRQEEELGKLRQARGVSNAIPVDGARRREPDDVSWPFDMNRPITRDKVKKEVSFFDE